MGTGHRRGAVPGVELAQQGVAARVVSVPCLDVFERQDASYRAEPLPRHLPRLAIEAGSTGLWWKYVGEQGDVIGLDGFGEILAHIVLGPWARKTLGPGLL
mgnify:CR=1 FL=1